MREIKFRGKRKDNGEWIYGDLIQTKEGIYILPQNSSIYSMGFIEVIPETVGQYINIKDSKKREIYEGDWVHCYGKYKGLWEFEATIPVDYKDLRGLRTIKKVEFVSILDAFNNLK